MDEIFVYIVPLPPDISEMVTPCADGYTIYINDRLSYVGRTKAYAHALRHINSRDFKRTNADIIEMWAHRGEDKT